MTATSMTFPADELAPRRAREWLNKHTRLDRVRRAEASLLLSELVTSALAEGAGRDDSVIVTAAPGPGTLVIGVERPGARPMQADPNGFRPMLLHRIARRWGEANRGRVWFEVPTPGSRERAAGAVGTEKLLWQASEPEALAELIARFSPLALRISRRFKGKGVGDEDVEQAARFGLMQALRRYDPAKGPFEPFAVTTITGELKRLLRDRGWALTVPRPLKERTLEVARTSHLLTQRLGRNPTSAEIADELGIDTALVDEAIVSAGAYQSGSLDTPVADTDVTMVDRMSDDLGPGADDAWHAVGAALSLMPERDRRILSLRFFEDMTQSEIAAEVGLSQMHVSRLLGKALERLEALLDED